jgi:hypothetical protein
MGTVSPPPGSLGPKGKKTGVGWPAIALVAVVAALLFTAARGYLKSQEKPPVPVVQPTAAVVHVQPTAAPALTPVPPVPTVDPEKNLKISESIVKMGLKTPSTYKRISGVELRSGAASAGGTSHVFQIDYDAQTIYGALVRDCAVAVFREEGGEIYYFRLDLIAPNPCNAIHPSQAGQKTILDLYEKFAGESTMRLTP